MDKDGYISNGELFQVLKMMVGNNLKDTQLQQIVDKTIIHADTDGDGKISFEEFCAVSICTYVPMLLFGAHVVCGQPHTSLSQLLVLLCNILPAIRDLKMQV